MSTKREEPPATEPAYSEEIRASAESEGVYAGIRVLDFSIFLAGPYCTRLMADMGAEVVKVEPPGGDFLRAAPPIRNGRSAYFGHLNCGKRSIALDLKRTESVELIRRLLPSCDVLLENFRPGVMARLGLDYGTVRRARPEIVYCSVTGYGQEGPSAGRPAFAPVVHAASGFDLLGPRYDPDLDRPITNRNATADYLAATHALAGIGAALFHRERTGRGSRLDVALMDTMHHALSYEYVDAQFPGQTPPTYRPMPTRDGFLAVAPVSEGNFRALAECAHRTDWLEDPRFRVREVRVRNWDALLDETAEWTRTLTSAEAEAALLARGCPASAYRTIAEAQNDPHVEARGARVRVEDRSGTFYAANCPIRFTESRAEIRPRIADLGEDAEAILDAIGYDTEEIQALRRRGVLPS